MTKAHAGDYTCTPYNTHGTSGTSGVMQVHVRDPPSIKLRPEDEYIRSVGEKVTFPCSASGTPTPSISWRREGGLSLPKKRHKEYQGTLTITGLQKQDHGLYECVVSKNSILSSKISEILYHKNICARISYHEIALRDAQANSCISYIKIKNIF